MTPPDVLAAALDVVEDVFRRTPAMRWLNEWADRFADTVERADRDLEDDRDDDPDGVAGLDRHLYGDDDDSGYRDETQRRRA